jgi:hypothetical protein
MKKKIFVVRIVAIHKKENAGRKLVLYKPCKIPDVSTRIRISGIIPKSSQTSEVLIPGRLG